jgi:hypothetical protein
MTNLIPQAGIISSVIVSFLAILIYPDKEPHARLLCVKQLQVVLFTILFTVIFSIRCYYFVLEHPELNTSAVQGACSLGGPSGAAAAAQPSSLSCRLYVDGGRLMSRLTAPLAPGVFATVEIDGTERASGDMFPFSIGLNSRVVKAGTDLFLRVNLENWKYREGDVCEYELVTSDGLWVLKVII